MLQFSSVQFSRSVLSDSLWSHESQHAKPPCPSSTPRVHLVSANYRVLICCTCEQSAIKTSRAVASSLFISASSVCTSLQGLISTLTQGGQGGHLLGSLAQLCSREGRTLQTNITGVYGECSQCADHTGFAPANSMCAFLVYTAQAPGCSAWELSKAGPGFRALPRSKLLRFRFLGTPQWHRLGWACVLCPSQAQGAQVTSAWWVHCPRWVVHLNHLPGPSLLVSQVCCKSTVSGVPCVSSG